MHPGEDEVSAALESALANFGTMVRRVGWRHRLSDADVDELVQDVRIRLWRARSGADRAGGEQIRQVTSSYVYRTAVSAALDLLRRRRSHHAEPLESDDELGEAVRVSEPVGPAEDLAQSELAEEIARAVETIAPARRPVVRMHLAGYPREEIAGILGWTEAKTRNLLYRGLADLRERLSARGIGWARGADEGGTHDDRTATT